MGKRLTELRGERSLRTVAKAIGVTESALSNYESGIRVPREDIKAAIANYYNRPVQSIFFT